MTLRSAMLFSLIVCVCAFFGMCALEGCAAAPTERAQARGAMVSVSHAARTLDQTCAAVALERSDLELARACERSYAAAREFLVDASELVDRWGDGGSDPRRRVACAVKHAAAEIAIMARDLEQRGARSPPAVADALAIVALLGICPKPEPKP